MASWLWGSLFRRVLQPLGAHSFTFFPILPYLNALLRCFGGFCSLWGLTVSLSSLFFPILMHSLGDVWHPGSGGSLFRRVCRFRRFCSLWGLTVSLSSLFFPILMHSLGDVWHPGSGVPCFGGFCSLWGLTVSLSFLFFPILMHSLGDVWHPGSGVPCFGGFCSLWGLTVSLSSLFPILPYLTFFPIPYLNAFLR